MTQANGDPYFPARPSSSASIYRTTGRSAAPTAELRPPLGQGLQPDRRLRHRQAAPTWNWSPSTVHLQSLRQSSIPHDDNQDFSPRVGFAYDITGRGKQVVRGGFGMYYGNIFQNIPLFMEQMANPTIFQTALSLTSPTDIVPGTGCPLGQWRYGVSPSHHSAALRRVGPGSVGRLMDPHYRNPITEEFNVGYTWAIDNNSAVETEYTHVLGIHENKTMNIDQRVPVNGVC